jgi:hypothetical protein
MSDNALLEDWAANRNNHRSVIVANEMMRRLIERRKEDEPR